MRNGSFSQGLKGTKTQQQRTQLADSAVPQREAKNSEISTRTQQESSSSQNRRPAIIFFGKELIHKQLLQH